MKLTNEMIKRIEETADELFYGYEIIGVRVQEEKFELGEMEHRSSVWEDGEATEETLDGVCVIGHDKLAEAQDYFGDHVAIIAGNRYTYGEDPGEVIIEDPVVVEVLA